MTTQSSRLARTSAGLIAFIATIALAVQVTVDTTRDGSVLLAAVNMLRFFTIWSNCAVAVILGLIAAGRPVGARVLLALATAIAIVALVYHALLAALVHPEGINWWTDQTFHSLIPALTVVWWLGFSATGPGQFRNLPWVVIAPILYSIVILTAARWTDFYPYFFLNVDRFGWPAVILNMVGLGAGFVIMGALLLAARTGVRRLA